MKVVLTILSAAMSRAYVYPVMLYLFGSYVYGDMSEMSGLLQEYCPGGNVCLAKEEEPVTTPYSCCLKCSCARQCHENSNCCFQNNSSKQLDSDSIYRKVTFCTYPSTKSLYDDDTVQFYNMVSYISSTNRISSESMPTVSCGDEQVAPWGSLYPVFSSHNNEIYKNMKCAEYEGVFDGKLWDAIMFCTSTNHNEDFSQFVQVLGTTEFPKTCSVDFIVPDIVKTNHKFRCFEPLTTNCLDPKDFELPKSTSLEKEIIVKLCEKGPVSPFNCKQQYANVFCHICNVVDINSGKTGTDNDNGNTFIGRLAFVGIIDQGFFEKRKTFGGQTNGVHQICDPEGSCRPLFCPSGKLRDNGGSCTYPNKHWLGGAFYISIILSLNKCINITTVFNVPFKDMTHILPKLKSPWSVKWNILQIFYEMDECRSGFTKSLAVMIYTNKNMVQPKSFITEIKRTIKRNWFLNYDGSILELKSEFAPMSFSTSSQMYPFSNVIFENESRNVTRKKHMKVYYNLEGEWPKYKISKLYICEQVELYESEFILSKGEEILFNIRTQSYMFDNQFTIISRYPEGILARICAEDYFRTEITDSNFGNIHSICHTCIISVAAIILKYCLI